MRYALSLVVSMVAVSGAMALGGCAQNRAQDRTKVMSAEITDLRQHSTALEGQLQGALSAQDRAAVDLQVKESQLREAQRQASMSAEAQQRAAQAEAAYAESQRSLAATQTELQRAQAAALAARSKPAPVAPSMSHQDSAEVEALRRDIADRLSRSGVTAPVEVRTTRSGQRKVALVLQDAYPAGSDSLAKNAKAVEAVARLSQVLQQSYPTSRIHIEGHTDSDPIRKSPWPSNDALSLARADQVKKLLLEGGLPTAQVETEGVGSRNPVEKGGTPRAKASNRRVEIYISPR